MVMIRCLAVDDEEYATEIIAHYIAKVPFLELVGTASSAVEALERVNQGDIDLVFLDIQMPEITGIQFLRLCSNKCKVILTTAYPQYALDGYEFEVVDYLLKPFEFERFLKAAQKALQRILPVISTNEGDIDTLSKKDVEPKNLDYIFVKGDSRNTFLKVNFDHILYVEGLKNYISIYTTDQRIVTYQSLGDLGNLLPKTSFYRVHKSYIVSVAKIRLIEGNTIYIKDAEIPIGDTYKESFFKMVRSNQRN